MNWSVCVDAGEADGIDAALDVRVLAVFVVEASANVDVAEADEADDAVDVAVLVAAAVDIYIYIYIYIYEAGQCRTCKA